jgi:hypothetical protein
MRFIIGGKFCSLQVESRHSAELHARDALIVQLRHDISEMQEDGTRAIGVQDKVG